MAYVERIGWTCDVPDCDAPASEALYAADGRLKGRYCTPHAALALKLQLIRERSN